MLLKTITVGVFLADFAFGQVVEEAKVFHGGGLSDDRFGWSVAMDGDWAAITSRETTFTQYGSVYLYRNDASGWTFVEEIQAFDKAPKDFFGFHVDLEGDRLIVGAHRDDNAMGVDAGAAYLFRRTGNDWSLEKKLVSPLGEANDVFGASVTISGDRIVVGAPNGGSFDGGAVHVWDLEDGDWTETAYLEPTQMFGLLSNFGVRSAIHNDRVFVGSSLGSKVYVFEEGPDGSWTEIELLQGVGGLGGIVAVGGDGKTLFAGANEDSDMANQAGAVFVYEEQSPGSWSLVQKLYSSQPKVIERFGHDLSLDGDRLLVGTQVNANDDFAQPFVYLFEDQGGIWTEVERFSASTPLSVNSGFGQAVAIRGQKILAGAAGDTGESPGTGAAYFHVLNTTPSPYCTGKTSSQGCAPTVDWGGSPTADGPDDFLVLTRNAAPAKPGLFFWGQNGPVAAPFLGGTLCVLPPLVRTPVQLSSGPAPCAAGYAHHFDQATMASAGLAPGAQVHGQFWMRDPAHPDGTGVVLTDGLAFTIGLAP